MSRFDDKCGLALTAAIAPRESAEVRAFGKHLGLIDLRTLVGFREVHIDLACNLALDRFDPQVARNERKSSPAESLYVIYRSGNRWNKALALERQFWSAAGASVLIDAVLDLTVHPHFALPSGFVGAGLVFANLTDNCGMAALPARRPWNRVSYVAAGTTCSA